LELETDVLNEKMLTKLLLRFLTQVKIIEKVVSLMILRVYLYELVKTEKPLNRPNGTWTLKNILDNFYQVCILITMFK